jgi:phospholipase/carboxylesterase
MPLAQYSSPAASFGAAPEGAPLAAVLLHGRDRTAQEMLDLAERIALPSVAWRAPAAPSGSWYPMGFMAPGEANQADLDRALYRVEREVRALEAAGLPRRRIALVGFSQGACVACEYVRRHPARWGALIAFTGGLPGPDGAVWTDAGGLGGTPVLLSNSEADPWVPWRRVEETADVFSRMGAAVTLRLYPGREHVVGDDEISEARTILAAAASQASLETSP